MLKYVISTTKLGIIYKVSKVQSRIKISMLCSIDLIETKRPQTKPIDRNLHLHNWRNFIISHENTSLLKGKTFPFPFWETSYIYIWTYMDVMLLLQIYNYLINVLLAQSRFLSCGDTCRAFTRACQPAWADGACWHMATGHPTPPSWAPNCNNEMIMNILKIDFRT